MHIITTKDKLNKSLSIVQKAVSNKTTLPILEGILFKAYGDKITLTGTDLEIGIITELSGNVVKEGSVVVSGKLITELARKLPDDEVTIELKENFVLNLRCLNSEFNIQGETGEDYPSIPSIDSSSEITIDRDLFKSMIKETIFSVAKNENIPILTGELIEISDGLIRFVALDGYRLALRQGKINQKVSLKEVVPQKTLSEIHRVSSISDVEFVSISTSKNQILFKLGDTSIISRLLEGEFMNYNQIIPQNCTTRVKIKTYDLLAGCERASLMVSGKSNLIKMNFYEDILLISSNSEMGSVSEEIHVKLEGDPIKIAFNSTYFIDVLKVLGDEEIILEFTTSVSPCVIKPVTGNNYTYLILPVRYIDYD